jgi:hypothetical protein
MQRILAAIIVTLAALCCAPAQSAILYSQTLGTTPAAVANNGPDPLTNYPNTPTAAESNCHAADGCFGKAGLVDVIGGNLPSGFTFNFTVSPTDLARLAANQQGGSATLTVTASRDIGHKAADAAANFDNLAVMFDGAALGTQLFLNTIDTCPATENTTVDTTCGPNFHNDVTAIDSTGISQTLFQAAAADGAIQVVLTPSANLGRAKIFSVKLEFTAPDIVPAVDPRWLLPLALILGLAGWVAIRRRAV